MSLKNKIDFAIVFSVKNANPNGDPINGNRPRVNFDNYGEVTDVCLKRKIRDRLQESGHEIFVQSAEKKIDGMTSLKARAVSEEHGLGGDAFKFDKPKKGEEETSLGKKEKTIAAACKKWFDVRAFGQVFAYKKGDDSTGVSIPIRGPVTLQSAFSIEPVEVTSIQITKSVNNEGDGTKKASDTMGAKHRVDSAVYVTYGAMSPQLAERTGFSDEDAESIKAILPRLFEGDASSARPEGSIKIEKIIWWEHNSKLGQYSSARVHETLEVQNDGGCVCKSLEGLEPEIIEGF